MKCFCQQRKSWGFKFITRLKIPVSKWAVSQPNVIHDSPPMRHSFSTDYHGTNPLGPTKRSFVNNNLSTLKLFPWTTPNTFFFKSQDAPQTKVD
jgi:hypothetical protein